MNLAQVEQLMYDCGYRTGKKMAVETPPPGFKDRSAAIAHFRPMHIAAVERNRDSEEEEEVRAYWYSLGWLQGLADHLDTPGGEYVK